MKNLILILLFTYTTGFSQQRYLTMSDELVPIIEEYIKDAEDRGFYIRYFLMRKLDLIDFDDTLGVGDDNRIGITFPDSKVILLSTKLLKNRLLLKIAVYHELGHLLKNSGYHSCIQCYSIMSAYAPDTILPYYNKEFFKKRIDEYFIWLNSSD